MTVAVLRPAFSFTVPVHRAAVHVERRGYYEEELKGGKYYVTKDERGGAVVGPKRHRGRALFSRKPRSTGSPEPEPQPPVPAPMEQVFEALRNIRVTPLGSFSPPPPPPRRRVRDWFSNWRDPEWHEAAQHTAKTVRMWSFTVFSVAIFAKGLLWILPM